MSFQILYFSQLPSYKWTGYVQQMFGNFELSNGNNYGDM